MYGLNIYPTQQQTPLDNEASLQMPKWPPQPTITLFMCIGASHPNIGQALQNSALYAEMQGIQLTWSPIEEGARTFASTQEVAHSTAVDALMRAIQAKPAGDGIIKAAVGEKRAHAQDAGAEGESGTGGSGASANAGDPMKHIDAQSRTATNPFYRDAPTPPARTPSPNSTTSKRAFFGTPVNAPSLVPPVAKGSSSAATSARTPLCTTLAAQRRSIPVAWTDAGNALHSWVT
ncbi:hypothetical protein V490_01584 [Pseudogymnoascus sp. VKM F-3557]|nr:hypothetical protein V490_01584 [Pseudogymnoascus sp. VKM F-3557]